MHKNDMPSGALVLLILRVLRSGPLHGYAIAQRIHTLSSDALRVEEGSLYPALQKILLKGWVTVGLGHVGDEPQSPLLHNSRVTGVKQLEAEASQFDRLTKAIQAILRTA